MRLPIFGRLSGGARDARRELLADIAGPERDAALALWARLTTDRRAAAAEVELIDELPGKWIEADAIFLHVAREVGAIAVIDWADGPEEILVTLDARLAALGKPPVGGDDARWIERYVVNAFRERGDAVGLAYGPLAHCLRARGLRTLLLQTWNDCYNLALVEPSVAKRWVGRPVSEAMAIEDPSWEFDAYLRNSRFAEFLVPRL